MTDWAQVQDAYGTADALPALLARAASATAPEDHVWSELWSRLCHQGTVYPASVAALPDLARIALTRAPSAYEPAMFLVAGILAPKDGAVDPEARPSLGADLGALRALAVRGLDLDLDDASFLWLLQTVAALDGVPVLEDRLEDVANEELETQCPVCDAGVVLLVDGAHLVAGTDVDGGGPRIDVRPAAEDALLPGAAAVVRLARGHGRDELAVLVLELLGEVTGPECGHRFILADAR